LGNVAIRKTGRDAGSFGRQRMIDETALTERPRFCAAAYRGHEMLASGI
jgi:hypothetical protein